VPSILNVPMCPVFMAPDTMRIMLKAALIRQARLS
jgi:hypothetical protein